MFMDMSWSAWTIVFVQVVYKQWVRQSVEANTFKGNGKYLPSDVGGYTYMYFMGYMSENVCVTGMHVTYISSQGKYTCVCQEVHR